MSEGVLDWRCWAAGALRRRYSSRGFSIFDSAEDCNRRGELGGRLQAKPKVQGDLQMLRQRSAEGLSVVGRATLPRSC